MNVISLNNLWTYLQGLSLTASNKKWLAKHLYEAAKKETETSIEPLALAREWESDPTLMTEEEFFAKLDRAEEQHRRGEGVRFTNREEMNVWLNSL